MLALLVTKFLWRDDLVWQSQAALLVCAQVGPEVGPEVGSDCAVLITDRACGSGRAFLDFRGLRQCAAVDDDDSIPHLSLFLSSLKSQSVARGCSTILFGAVFSSQSFIMSMNLKYSGSDVSQIGIHRAAMVKSMYEDVRANFPYYDPRKKHPVFMENAGGSQCPSVVVDAIGNYMRNSYVQLGAGYELSNRATETVESAHRFMKIFMNAEGVGEVALGPSSSQLVASLGESYGRVLNPGDEVIVHEANHEANAGPWVNMAKRGGYGLKFWSVNPDNFKSSLEVLGNLLSPSTRIVAVSHVSNILGEILDVESVVKFVKEKVGSKKVRVVVDGVAYAPHRALDVAKWGVDWYVFSTYKTYGPHMAALFGTFDAFDDVKEEGPNFGFISPSDLPNKFELGGASHEGCAGILAISQYLEALAQIGVSGIETLKLQRDSILDVGASKTPQYLVPESIDGCIHGSLGSGTSPTVPDAKEKKLPATLARLQLQETNDQAYVQHIDSDIGTLEAFGRKALSSFDRSVVEAAFATAKLLEQPLQRALLQFLRSKTEVVIVGPTNSDATTRVPTISFVHMTKSSSRIALELHKAGFAVRNGHMYAHRLVSTLVTKKKLFTDSVNDGVVRISMVHYNTPQEVTHLISCLNAVL